MTISYLAKLLLYLFPPPIHLLLFPTVCTKDVGKCAQTLIVLKSIPIKTEVLSINKFKMHYLKVST